MIWVLAGSVLAAVGLVLWRIWPLLMGRVRAGDDAQDRLARWNRYLLTLGDKLLVARAGFVGPPGGQRTIATWTLEPTMLPDVELIAIARPGSADAPEIQAIGEAARLRELLPGHVQSQTLWGHTAYVHVWPHDADLDAFVARLTPVDRFRAELGLEADANLESSP